MSSHPLSEDYFRYLVPQIRDEEDGMSNRNRTFLDLCQIMYETDFTWFVPNDDNRLEDGRELRREFCHAYHIRAGSLANLNPYCSFLEVLIGLSRRLSFAAGGPAPPWAWQLISNLELKRMSDPLSPRKVKAVEEILSVCINRTYEPNGHGGFFPLAWPEEGQDQRNVELWYQMADYIHELHPENRASG